VQRKIAFELGGENLPIKAASPCLLNELSNGFMRITLAGSTPIQKLRHVHPALSNFALMNPRLGAFHPAGQVALRQIRLLADLPEQSRDVTRTGRIRLLGHTPEASPRTPCLASAGLASQKNRF
jgi:hypothetical protein